MTYEIITLEQDMAQKWRARVLMTDGSTRFFKFQQKPTQEEIDVEVDRILIAEAEALVQMEAQRRQAIIDAYQALIESEQST